MTVLPFLLSDPASKNAAFLPDKAMGAHQVGMKVFSGVLRGGDCIGDARSAWRGCWRFGLQRSTRAGWHKVAHAPWQPCSPCRYSQGFP